MASVGDVSHHDAIGDRVPELQEPEPRWIASLDEIGRSECLGLLATTSVGRLGLIVDGKPEVLPVNFGLDGDSVLFRTAEGTVLTQARHRVVAFEADQVDETTHTGWSVLVQGLTHDITDTIDPTSERLRRLAVITWAPDPRQRLFRVIPDRITGRRLRVYPDAL